MSFVLTLESRKCEFDQVHTFHFKPADNAPIVFEAGMYVHLVSPDAKSVNKDSVRHMSFASAPEEGTLSFTMDLASGTQFKKVTSSTFLHNF